MFIRDEKPVLSTDEWLHAEVRRLEWAKGLAEETPTAITSTVDSEITHAYFLIPGRMKARLYDLLGKLDSGLFDSSRMSPTGLIRSDSCCKPIPAAILPKPAGFDFPSPRTKSEQRLDEPTRKPHQGAW